MARIYRFLRPAVHDLSVQGPQVFSVTLHSSGARQSSSPTQPVVAGQSAPPPPDIPTRVKLPWLTASPMGLLRRRSAGR